MEWVAAISGETYGTWSDTNIKSGIGRLARLFQWITLPSLVGDALGNGRFGLEAKSPREARAPADFAQLQQIDLGIYSQFLELVVRSNAGQKQQTRRVYGAGGEHHLMISPVPFVRRRLSQS